MKTLTKELQEKLTPLEALGLLKAGNKRYLDKKPFERDFLEQIQVTASGQYPFAVVLGCIDSRVPLEHVFDQGFGDIFAARVAGNIINEDILGSMEYGCKVAGSKVILVLGHTKCGAVTSACDHVEMGNITPLLAKIKPAISEIEAQKGVTVTTEHSDLVSVANVKNSIKEIREKSPILKEMEDNGELIIAGGMYDISSGEVTFY